MGAFSITVRINASAMPSVRANVSSVTKYRSITCIIMSAAPQAVW